MIPHWDYAAMAENVIKTEGLIFALAVKSGGDDDMRTARQYLKEAIIRALKEAGGAK